MQCRNHPQVMAKDRCSGCAEPFCENCLGPVQGRFCCAQCKVIGLRGRGAVAAETRTQICSQAREALVIAVAASLCPCWALFVAPWAIVRAAQARETIRRKPSLLGRNMATAAIVIAVIELLTLAVGALVGLVGMSRRME